MCQLLRERSLGKLFSGYIFQGKQVSSAFEIHYSPMSKCSNLPHKSWLVLHILVHIATHSLYDGNKRLVIKVVNKGRKKDKRPFTKKNFWMCVSAMKNISAAVASTILFYDPCHS